MNTPESSDAQYTTFFQLISRRLYWFFIGPMFLMLMLLGVFNGERAQLIVFNVLYCAALMLMPVSRALDIRTGHATTAAGEPADWTHWRKYSIVSVTIGLAALAAADAWVLMRNGN